MTKKVKTNVRQLYIDSIMTNKYGDDDPKYDGRNLSYLNSLTLEELKDLSTEDFDEDDDDNDFNEETDAYLNEGMDDDDEL